MAPRNPLEKAARLTVRIVAETTRAVALHAIWARCADSADVASQVGAELAFPLVRDALLIDLTMTLCRLHEVGQDASATFPRVFRALNDASEIAFLRHPAGYEAAKSRHDELMASGAVKRVRDLRDRVLAHNDTRGVTEGPIFGDATELVNASVELATLLHRAVTGSMPEFPRHTAAWELGADSFWRRFIGAPPAGSL